MKKTALVLSALAFSIGMAMGPMTASAAETASSSTQQLPSLAPMLEKVMPSVVSINVEGSTTVNTAKMPPQFQQFFGEDSPFCQDGSPFQASPMCQGGGQGAPGQGTQQKFQALGAGVVIDAAKGYVVTNNHVVENANKIQVQLNDGRKFDAKVIGKDPRSDIALIQLKDFKNLTAIKMADSEQLRVGDYTVAIGNPYGLGETATSGIVSALGRSGLNIENYENFIQTDAAINRGNSGGALVNLNGELIGINTAILAPDGGNIGIGFAIPSNMVKNLTAQMVEFGQVKRGELGIMGTELNSELAKAMKVDAQRGAFVSQVMPKSSAAKAGIKAGDVIVTMNGKAISSFASFRAEIGTLPVGSKMSLGIIRDGKPITVDVTLEQSSQTQVESGNIYTGIEGAELSNGQTGSQKGVKVDNVKAGSAAARIGLKKGDFILGVNQQPIQNLGELRKILDSKPSVLALNILRGDTTLYLLMQ
ncbi:serine endoprotease DegP [Serratia proteamaculans]|jgi:serine protease Do|uniref:serine endoprotease DegP n=1 Tax=Serratia proteamaculans TaxID=28151 RepID=UPI00217A4462|nr:serine endoprotease DegP [Serratia proteamaculans]CAI1133972.1 Periplasmic serine endoprotease DegP precursor [Serratia proteamaculans]CAI1732086.1 Periplasmic serine endoprotease DegP precursor [Serratia proteamaculans]CAI1803765.1 Periplasmic serine endoprotease DegP precursor [Serratia proteamaculans]CAI1808746.1 Periplasmic serine endoprotease DegP precursor [Serratia proteamaculans]CAI1888079.1 Periplasmic serine endoprotease DegP precursor [Serratia proteamaculans]